MFNSACKVFFYAFVVMSFSKNSFWNFIRVSNNVDPDQDQHSVGPDLGLNCLQRQRTNVAASKKGVI